MKPIHLLTGLYCVATATLDLSVMSTLRTSVPWPLMVLVGLAFGQLAMLALWSVWGPGWRPIRLAMLLGVACVLSVPLSRATSGSWSHWFTLQCLVAAGLAAIAWVGQRTPVVGWTGGLSSSGATRFAHVSPRQRYQCSLGGLLSLLTVSGLLLGAARHLSVPVEYGPTFFGSAVFLLWVATAAFWASAPARASAARLFAMLLLCVVPGWLVAHVDSDFDWRFFSGIGLVQSLYIYLSVAVLSLGSIGVAPTSTAICHTGGSVAWGDCTDQNSCHSM